MKRLAVILIVLLMTCAVSAAELKAVADTAAVKDVTGTTASYQLPNPSDKYCISADFEDVYIHWGASGVVATTAVGGYTKLLQDGATFCAVFKPTTGTAVYVAYISTTTGGRVTFLQLDR